MNEITDTGKRISRRQSYRGQWVRVSLRDGNTVTGVLLAWGSSVLRIQASATGKWREMSVTRIERVDEITPAQAGMADRPGIEACCEKCGAGIRAGETLCSFCQRMARIIAGQGA